MFVSVSVTGLAFVLAISLPPPPIPQHTLTPARNKHSECPPASPTTPKVASYLASYPEAKPILNIDHISRRQYVIFESQS